MNYEEALAFLSSLAPRGWRLGLDRMREYTRRAGLEPHLGATGLPQYWHIAGTNGKGSVTAYLQSLAVESGFRTGAYFSPYVFDPMERVQLGREFLNREAFAEISTSLLPIAESFTETEYGGITEFEFKTAIGFETWRRARCEWVALEVGLGGRLDATNVVTPRASAIVSIGLDHATVLGDTEELIAAEKAGIIKPGVPVVVGEMAPGPRGVIESHARAAESPLWRWGHEVRVARNPDPARIDVLTPAGCFEGLKPGLEGAMQGHNLALAVATFAASGAKVDSEAIARGAENAHIAGRFQIVEFGGLTWVLDGAHNAQAAVVLARSLHKRFGPRKQVVLLTSMVAGHDVGAFYSALAPIARRAFVPPIDFHRAADPLQLARTLASIGVDTTAEVTVDDAVDAAMNEACRGDVVLVTGSFYLLGEVGKALRARGARL